MRMTKLVLISMLLISLSGCALIPTKTIVLGGVKDIIDVPKGAKVCGITLPTDEAGKTYCVVATESSRLLTMKAYDILEKSK